MILNVLGDSMLYYNGMFFSIYDMDNDNWLNNCGLFYWGVWWYNVCYNLNFNGEYGNINFG